jgi:hypothetical protein
MGTRDYDTAIRGLGYQGYPNQQNLAVNNANARKAWRSSSPRTLRHKPTGWIAPSSYFLEEGSWQYPRGSIVESSGWRSDGYLNIISPLAMFQEDCAQLGIPGSFPASLANRAVQNVRLKVKDQSFNVAQAFAERAQTAQLVGGSLRRIATAAMDIRKGKFERGLSRLGFRSADAAVKTLPDAVLAFQYGVRPLAQDIYGACDALDKADRGVWINTARSKVQEVYSLSRLRGNPSTTGYASAFGEVMFGAFARLDTVPGNQALASAASLGLTNPAYLAWELVPFSFVVDWAYPLGDYFSQFDALAGVEVKGYSLSTITRAKVRYQGRNNPGFQNTVNWDSFYRRVRLDRTASMTVPFARLPSLKDPFNSKDHVLNGLALLAAAFR